MSYQASAKDGKAIYLAMVSDWDVDAAFLGSSDPVLRLKVEVKLFEQGELLHEKLGNLFVQFGSVCIFVYPRA